LVSARQIAGAVALAAAIGLLIHLEARLGSQTAALEAIGKQVAAMGRAPGPGPAPVIVQAAPGPGALDPASIQAIARAVDQMQARRVQAAEQASAQAASDPPVRTVEQEKAIAEATDVATQSIAKGKLTRDDVLKMRSDMASGQSTPQERDALRGQIAVAINAQKLVVQDPRFIYP
jgi:hypothetical protein